MKALMILCLALLTGCATTYDVSRCEGDKCATANIKSYREFEQVVVNYERETGTFSFSAGSAQRGISPLEQAAADIARAAVLTSKD